MKINSANHLFANDSIMPTCWSEYFKMKTQRRNTHTHKKK